MRIERQPWVSDPHINHMNGTTHWRIGVSDTDAAKAHLIQQVLKVDGVQVRGYSPEAYELEDLFMQIVQQ